ncbi:rare lipoprotein A [Methylobacterium sp. PvR107]|nr:rare lipoprotein A [Methylobacterium sp. PvR107]
MRVTNTRNGQSVVVRINDRDPYVGRRMIDL